MIVSPEHSEANNKQKSESDTKKLMDLNRHFAWQITQVKHIMVFTKEGNTGRKHQVQQDRRG